MRQRFEWYLAGSLVLFVGMFVGTIWSNSHPSWANWQIKYYREQEKILNGKIAVTQNPVLKKYLEQQRDSMKDKKPEVKMSALPNGKVERCQTCHLGIEEISKSHPAETFGCTVCHGGNPLSLNQNQAHAGMYGAGHPGQLDVSALSCGSQNSNGQCHSGHVRTEDNQVDLVQTSLMANKGGELSMLRYMHGLDIPPKISIRPGQIAMRVPAPFNGLPLERDLQLNCLNQCHQSNGHLPEQEMQANGCESCHMLTNWDHTYQGQDVTISARDVGHSLNHRLTTQIPYTQCNQCHNQGMPNLYSMHFEPRPDLTRMKASFESEQESPSDRMHNVYQPGMVFTQCEVELDCIDCHTRQEVMGDGHLYTSEYQALKIQCLDCHGTKEKRPTAWTVNVLEDIAFEEERVNPVFPELKIGEQVLKTASGEELPYIRLEGSHWVLSRKVTGEKYPIPLVYGSACQQDAEHQTSNDCHKCHDVSGNLKK